MEAHFCVAQAYLVYAQELSHTGANMYDPWGRYQLVFPRLLSYVVDDPEGKDVACIKGGRTNHSCERCWVHSEKLVHIDKQYAPRTERKQTELYNKISTTRKTNRTEGDKVAAEYSTHPVPSPVWGFKDQDVGVGNSMMCFGFEAMHNEDLGVFLYIVDHVDTYFRTVMRPRDASRCVQVLNSRLSSLPRAGKQLCTLHTCGFVSRGRLTVIVYCRGLSVAQV
jgi:hypothetical protein